MVRLLLLSNSTMSGTKYLEYAQSTIAKFLYPNVKQILFIPFAAVSFSWDAYVSKVQEGIPQVKVLGIHQTNDYMSAIASAEAIVIGGGNTFNLLYHLQENNLIDPIRKRVVNDGVPYVGWSAGSNVATPDIGTTNDMPVIWPKTDAALNLVPFNINPHYNEWKPPNYQGEGRKDRLDECCIVRKRPIVAITEGLGIHVENGKHVIIAPDLGSYNGQDQRCAKIWIPDDTSSTGSNVISVGFGEDITPYMS